MPRHRRKRESFYPKARMPDITMHVPRSSFANLEYAYRTACRGEVEPTAIHINFGPWYNLIREVAERGVDGFHYRHARFYMTSRVDANSIRIVSPSRTVELRINATT